MKSGIIRKKHVLNYTDYICILTGLMLFLFSVVVNNPCSPSALGSERPSFHLGLIVFGILYSPLSLVIGLLSNYISRKNEFDADRVC